MRVFLGFLVHRPEYTKGENFWRSILSITIFFLVGINCTIVLQYTGYSNIRSYAVNLNLQFRRVPRRATRSTSLRVYESTVSSGKQVNNQQVKHSDAKQCIG